MKEKAGKIVGVLYSGGKDSTFACQKLREEGHEIACLITVVSENKDSYMLHTANIEMTSLSAKAMGVPLVRGATSGLKEVELLDIEAAILEAKKEYGLEAVASGAIRSEYQKTRVESVGSKCGLDVLSPLWHLDQVEYFKRLLSNHYRIIMTSVSAEGLGPDWLGRELTSASLNRLEELSRIFRFNIALEGGEAETLVLDCPLFKKAIEILTSKVCWNGYSGLLKIEKAALREKRSAENQTQ